MVDYFLKPVSPIDSEPTSKPKSNCTFHVGISPLVSLRVSSLFKRSTEVSSEPSSVETPSPSIDDVDIGDMIRVLEGIPELLTLSERMIEMIEEEHANQSDSAEQEVESIIHIFSTLQSQFDIFSTYFGHLKDAFHLLHQLKQNEKISFYLSVCESSSLLLVTSPTS